MGTMDFPFVVEIFFGISFVVFCIAMYVILPAFMYKKRTVFKPKLINAMWNKFFTEPRLKLGNSWTDRKKKSRGVMG